MKKINNTNQSQTPSPLPLLRSEKKTLPPPSLVGRERNDLWMGALLDGDHPPP